jgi:hypothetical protein
LRIPTTFSGVIIIMCHGFPVFPHFCSTFLGGLTIVAMAISAAHGADKKGSSMSYAEAREFLAKHTDLIELTNDAGARVAIAPGWQGRVMTSTCGGLEGPSFGFVNRDYIEAGKTDAHFNNLGAEERLWLCPEGGPFSLWFKPGAKQVMQNWFTPPALNEGAWKVVSAPDAPRVRMAGHMKFENTSAATFDLDVTREVRLLGTDDFRSLFGDSAAAAIGKSGVKTVAYETANQITNRGPAFSKKKGLVSIWILGMMNAGPQTIILVPYRSGPEEQLGPVVKSDYFGAVPADRLKVTPEAVLFRADNNFRSKIGTSQQRARNVLGSIDFQAGVLTLVHFTMPDEPAKQDYMNNMWGVPQAKPYTGDVANAYNDGPNDLGRRMGAFYEIESVSPALTLKTGESLLHRHRTVHIQADMDTLRELAKEILGVDLDSVRKEMLAN